MNPAARRLAAMAVFFGLTAVILGAFGAHALKSRLDAAQLLSFETAVRYQMYHALALLLVAALRDRLPSRALETAGWLFVAGTVLFSGSIYLLVSGVRWVWPVTPIGGVTFMAGWISLGIGCLRSPR